MPDPETASTEVPLRRRKRVRLIVLLALLAAVWFAHPYVLDWGIRKVLPLALAPAGLEIEIGKIQANFARPFHFENVVLKVVRPKASRTRIEVGTLDASLNWPWQIVFGEGRFFRKAVAQDWSVYADTRKVAMPTDPMPQFTPDQEQNIAAMVLRALPQDIDLQDGSVKVMGDDQSFEFDRVSATFSENALGTLVSRNSVIRLGKGVHRFAELKGVTAWKNGTAYAADVTLRPDIRIDSYHIDLARPGGLSMEFVADLFGGSLRGGLTLGAEKGLPKIDGALWVSNIGLASFPALAGEKTDIGGTVREARFTFRGNPDRPLEAEAALWAVADGVQWNKRGWESLELGANLIHQRLTVSNFNLRQKMNRLGGNGEVSLAGGWESLSDAPFLANMTGDIQDLGALAGLIGAPFDEMTGRMSLNGSVSGSAGKLDGFLSVEGSQIGYRAHPIESAKIDIRFAGEEAQIERCEIWSGDDYLRAQGSMGLKKPFHYGGELQARALDLAQYAMLFRAPGAESVYSGSLQLRWQGDGTLSANSGAFTLSVDDFVSEFTPSGLTGRFSATYSPENLYFSNLELAHDGMLFSTRATAAKDGLTLKNAVLRSGKKEVAGGEVFLPINIFALGNGTSWAKALNTEKPFFASIATRGALDLEDLSALAGQELPVAGKIQGNLTASGSVLEPQLAGKVDVREITLKSGENAVPPGNLSLDLSSKDGRAWVQGKLETKGFDPVTLQANTPFGFTKENEGDLKWRNPDGVVEGRLDLPRTDLRVFQPMFPQIRGIGGALSGNITLGGKFQAPSLTGTLGLKDAWFQANQRAPRISNVNVGVNFDAQQAVISQGTAEIAGGPATFSGSVNFATPSNLKYDLTARGEKVLLGRDPSLRLRANVDLKASGDNGGGNVSGSVRLVDGRLYKRIEITPLLAPSPTDDDIYIPPNFAGIVPSPFNNWKVDLSVTNETPFLIQGNIASGEIIPNLKFSGTLGNPIPEGQVDLKQARAYLPFTTMFINEGVVKFDASAPWMPQLDIRGAAEVLDYDVQIYAYGPLNERRIILRSDPPLSQEQLVLLLTTGFAPGVFSGAGFGEAAIGQGSLLLMRAFARQFETQGVDLDSFINRLQVTAQPPRDQTEQATLRARFRIWQGLSLMSSRDGYGFYNAGATYTLRFR